MAEVGSNFPAGFAMGILQLAQQKKIRDAELVEMRNDRASRNFLEKQRLDLQAQAQFQSQAMQGNQMAFQQEQQKAELEVQKTAQTARIQLETKKIEQEREAVVAKSADDFGRTGSAFFPTYALDKASKITSSGSSEFSIAQINVPGAGVLLQRIDHPELKSKLDKTQAEISKINQEAATSHARQELLTAQKAKFDQDVQSLVGKVGGPSVVTSLNHQWDALQKQALDRANSLSLLGANPQEKALGQRIQIDPREAFIDNPEQLKLYDGTRKALNAITLSIQRGIDVNSVKTDLSATDAVDVTHAITNPYTNETIVGKVTAGPNERFLVTSSGRRISVSPQQYTNTKLGTPAGSSSPPISQTTPPPAAPAAASPQSRAALDAEGKELLSTYQNPKSSPADKESARLRIIEIKKALEQ